MTVTGYHTVEDRGDIDYVEKYGPFKCTRSNAWLGHGYYFWDTRVKWAHEWGKNAYGEDNYVICKGEIDNNERCFDLLGNVGHQELFEVFEEELMKKSNKKVIVPQIIEYIKRKFPDFLEQFDAIRAYDNPKPKIYSFGRREYLTTNLRVQICLINKKPLNLQTFSVIYPL